MDKSDYIDPMSTSHSISLSAAAARHINALSSESGHEIMLRIAVEGGGCSGFQYQLDLVEAAEEGDSVISYEGRAPWLMRFPPHCSADQLLIMSRNW